MLTRRQSRELTPFTRSHTPYGLITPKVTRVAKRVRRDIDASAHNATLTLIAEELVLATVIEYLRRESGSLLRRDTGNFIDVSAVCRDFRAINRSCAEQWLAGLNKPTVYAWSIPRFSSYLHGSVHNTNVLNSAQFLRGSNNFRLCLGFMDGKQMNSEGAWLPLSECPRSVEPPSHLCISLAIADKDKFNGSIGPVEVTFTLHHRDPRFSVERTMTRTFCWGNSGAEVSNAHKTPPLTRPYKNNRLTPFSLLRAVRLGDRPLPLPLVARDPQLLQARDDPLRYARFHARRYC